MLTPVARILFVIAFATLMAPVKASAQATQSTPAFHFASSVVLGTAPATATTVVNISAAGTLSKINVLTQGIPNEDFSLATGGSCSVGTAYFAGQTCTVALAFGPKYPGVRHGAIVLVDNGGNVLGNELLNGTCLGAMASMIPVSVSSVVGNGTWTYRGDGMPGTSASLYLPMGGTADAAGNLFIADSNDQRIRRLDAASQLISTVAGRGSPGFSGDGGPATAASLATPSDVKMDGAGNLFIADSGNQVIRFVNATTGIIQTIAGIGGVSGYSGDGGQATLANLTDPGSLAFDGDHILYISDSGNNVVRKLDLSTGIITTYAGNGTGGFGGDGGPATAGKLNDPWGLALGNDGSLYIADILNNRIRKVSPAGVLSTFAGTGAIGFAGDNGLATAATLNVPAAVATDAAGNVFIADSGNSMVREVNATTGIIISHVGNQSGYSDGSGAAPNVSTFDGPYGLFFDGPGNLYVSDMFHQTLRAMSPQNVTLAYGEMREGKVSPPRLVVVENDGNAPLAFSAFSTVAYSQLDPSTTTCQLTIPLAAAASCNLGVVSAPTATGNWLVGFLSVQSNTGNGPGNITLLTDALAVDPTLIALASSSNPSTLGVSITLTASVTTSGTTPPTGLVSYFDGSVLLGTATLNSASAAHFAVSSLATGSHALTAVYAGDDQNATATSAPLAQIVKQPTVTTLTSNPNPAVTQVSVTFTASVAAPSGSTVSPTGTVTFYDGSATLGAGTVNASGIAVFSTSNLAAGPHNIVAKYGGDLSDLASQSSLLQETISQTPTRTLLTSSSATIGAGASVTFTSVVSRTDGAIPTGVVTFLDGSTSIGAATLDGTGTGVWTATKLAAGTHSITAVYAGDSNNLTSTSAALIVTVQQIPTSTALAINANPAVAGAVISMSATVSAAFSSTGNASGSNVSTAGALAGNVTFQEGTTVLGAVAVSSTGVATLPVTSLSVGMHHITAVYAGSTNYSGSASSLMAEAITAAGTSTALTSSATPSIAGTPVTFTATVTSNGGTPTGTITLIDSSGGGSVIVGTAVLNAQGVASLTTASLSFGQHALTASYGGDAKDNPSTSPVFIQTVQLASTSDSLTSSANPSSIGAPVVFTSTVTTSGGSTSGTVKFNDGTALLGTANLIGGKASFATSSLTLGSHAITSVYSGDPNNAASQSSVLTQTVLQASGVALTSSSNPSIAGTNLTLTATVSEPQGVAVTGTVAFKEGSALLGTAVVGPSGTAVLNLSTLSVGQHQVVAAYSGDSGSQAAVSTVLLQTVQTAGTTVTLISSANPSLSNAPLTLTSTVTGRGGIVTGTVTFEDGVTILGTANVNSGVATFLVPGMSPGIHSIIAVYGGDANNTQSTSPVLSQSVVQTATVALSSSQNPSLALDSVVFTTRVSNGSSNAPSGTVIFRDGSKTLGTVTLDATGTAVFTDAAMTTGQHPIAATYSGDAVNLPGVSVVLTQSVQLRPTTDTLTASSTSLSGGQQVTLISVVHFSGPAIPTGSITFTSSGVVLGTSAVDNTGVATLTVNLLTSAPTVLSSYSGDSVYSASNSGQTNITVNKPTQFTMAMNPTSISVQSKQYTTSILTLTSVNDFTDKLDLGCLALPFAATCTFTNDQVPLAANGVQTIQVVIDTGSPLTAGSQARLERHNTASIATLCSLPLGALLLLLLPIKSIRSRKSLAGLYWLLLLGCLSAGVTGCSGLHINGTPPGTYVFQVTASGSGTGVTQSIDMTLTVTQ